MTPHIQITHMLCNAPVNVYLHYLPPGLPEVRLGDLTSPSLKASTWGPSY